MLYLIDPLTDFLLILFLEIFAFLMFPILALLYFGYNRRKSFALKMLRRNFFHAGLIRPSGALSWRNYLEKEIQIINEKISVIKWGKALYRMPSSTVSNGRIPLYLWREGNPISINLFQELPKEALIHSAQEFKEAIDDQVTHDLLKFNFSKLEYTYIVLAIINMLLVGVVIYELYDLSNVVNNIAIYLANNIPKIVPH